jgi:hypothetical protein
MFEEDKNFEVMLIGNNNLLSKGIIVQRWKKGEAGEKDTLVKETFLENNDIMPGFDYQLWEFYFEEGEYLVVDSYEE